MEPAHESTVTFRRRLLGYDRREVEQALTSTTEALWRARARCDELAADATNVERIGAEVADMIRALAERAVELEDEAAADAQRTMEEARRDAEDIRAEAAALLADAKRQADALLADFGRRQAAASTRRQTAVAALHTAMDQIRRLTGSIEEIGPDVFGDGTGLDAPSWMDSERDAVPADEDPGSSTNVIVLGPNAAASTEDTAEPALPEATSVDDEDSVAAAMARISKLTESLS